MKQKWDTEKEGLVEVILTGQKKCTRQFVQSAARNAKFLSSQAMIQTESQDLCTAGTATKSTNQHEGSKQFNFLANRKLNFFIFYIVLNRNSTMLAGAYANAAFYAF